MDNKKISRLVKYGNLKEINPDNVLCCLAAKSYTEILLINSERIIISKRLGIVEKFFRNKNLIRSHKSVLANLKHIELITTSKPHAILMANGQEVLMCQRKKKEINEKLIKFRLKTGGLGISDNE